MNARLWGGAGMPGCPVYRGAGGPDGGGGPPARAGAAWSAVPAGEPVGFLCDLLLVVFGRRFVQGHRGCGVGEEVAHAFGGLVGADLDVAGAVAVEGSGRYVVTEVPCHAV